LSEVDDFGLILIGGNDVVGLHIGVYEASFVHVEKCFCYLLEDFDCIENGFGRMLIKRHAIDELHDEVEFGYAHEFAIFQDLMYIAEFGVLEF